MRISVIGVGYLGAVHATAMASLGHDVVGVDVDAKRIEALVAGRAPFFEPGFDDLLSDLSADHRLTWTCDFAAIADADVHFVCVGTPQRPGSRSADLTYLDSAVESILPHLRPGSVVAGKSTVPVGTAATISDRITREWRGESAAAVPTLVWNPEFLREGTAVQDTLTPDRIVVGVPKGAHGQRALDVMRNLYATMTASGSPLIVTDLATAELVKTSANAFLATKISFINAMAEVCEATGADVQALADAIGHDERIGRKFLGAGIGFGGGCLPKDIRAFSARAGELGVDQALTFLNEVDAINQRRRQRSVEKVRELVGGHLQGRCVTVLGAAFKPNSDDVRDSPALDIAARLHNEGARVVVHDPKALINAALVFPALQYEQDLDRALDSADVVLLLTEWPEYVSLDPELLATKVAHPRILDGRNALDADEWREAGWLYRGMGREGE